MASFAEGLVGIVLDGRYRLDAVLGEGGMGAVFRAHHLAMDRKVAVKLLKPHLTTDEAALQRFAREARATMRVDSPHAVKVLDFGITPHRDYYMVLEYLDGRTVQRELDVDGPFAPARAIHIVTQAARALGAAHASGLVHRDVKPDNLLLLRSGDDPDFTKVLDFGVAKLMEGAARSTKSQLSLTQAGTVFGTPEFMSPEQACGQTLDGRSDIYSLAATMFAMLTGRGLFVAGSAIEWLTSHVRTPPPHLVDGLPELAPLERLDELLQRCLAKRPEHRPQTADALVDELEALDDPRPTPIAFADTAAHKPAIASTFSPSAFVSPLAITPDEPIVRTSRRGTWIAMAAAGALVVAAIVVAATRQAPAPPTPPPLPPQVAAVAPPAPVAPVTKQAVTPQPAPPTPTPPYHNATASPANTGRAVRSTIDNYLAEAEAAKKLGNRMRWVSQADSALRLDPTNPRAKLLLAEGLIAYGDLEHGCKYLRELGRNPTAQKMAQASCQGN
ncbi:MAG TPA: serine/threonine-protein kinase [Kofleriaceae bacterium]|nr:serine/threonine-protein kinase [Kofleriaceae bacterium]